MKEKLLDFMGDWFINFGMYWMGAVLIFILFDVQSTDTRILQSAGILIITSGVFTVGQHLIDHKFQKSKHKPAAS